MTLPSICLSNKIVRAPVVDILMDRRELKVSVRANITFNYSTTHQYQAKDCKLVN